MSMSLFSAFDALLAEKFGQRVSLSWATSKQQASPSSPSTIGKEGYSSSSHPNKPQQEHHPQQQQKKRRPRFAVELDGVHCFETIIPY